MSDDQAHGRTTRDSAAGSTSGSLPIAMAVGETVCVDGPHVDGSRTGSERRQMVSTLGSGVRISKLAAQVLSNRREVSTANFEI